MKPEVYKKAAKVYRRAAELVQKEKFACNCINKVSDHFVYRIALEKWFKPDDCFSTAWYTAGGPSVQVVAYEVIPDLIRICMDEYDKGIRPEHIGKRRDIYVKCYKTVLEHLKSRSETTLDN